MRKLANQITDLWYRPSLSVWCWLLKPFSWLFFFVIRLRCFCYQKQWLSTYRSRLPIIVVGNLTVGGGGKTPFVIALCHYLKCLGYQPGVVSRGYGRVGHQCRMVEPEVTAEQVGDEPILIAQQANVPVCVAVKRAEAVKQLEALACDVVVSDDGLQHYAIQRDIEMVLVDGERGFGNQQLLPAGPLREPLSRLHSVDVVASVNPAYAQHGGYSIKPMSITRLVDGQTCSVDEFGRKPIHAVAGIANPAGFFGLLESLGFEIIKHAFADHHAFQPQDFDFAAEEAIILMTDKDAVKCQSWQDKRLWALSIQAVFSETLKHKIRQLLEAIE